MIVTGKFRVNEPQVTAKVMDGEAVIIHLGTGIYYSMDGVGCRVWERLAAGDDVQAISDGIASRYGIDRDIVAAEMEKLLAELVGQDLLASADGAAPPPAASQDWPDTYDSPALKRFDDMAELLALDPPLPAASR